MNRRLRLKDRRAGRRDGRRFTDERPTMSIVEACRELGMEPLRGNGKLIEEARP